MKLGIIASLIALFAVQQPPSPAQAAAAAANARAATPADCLKAANDFYDGRVAERQGQRSATVWQEKAAVAKQCAARLDVKTVAPASLLSLAELYTLAEQPELATAAVDRGLAATNLAPADRAALLLQAVKTGLTTPKSRERDAQLETLVGTMDALAPAAFERVLDAHLAMRAYYFADDIESGLVKHATWIMDAARRFTADQRKTYGRSAVTAHLDIAAAWAGEDRTAQAFALLKRVKTEWADVPDPSGRVDREIARLELVGTTAASLTAPRWLNMPAGVTELDLKGPVTLLEFTAWWCGPCIKSYPGLNRLRQRFGAQGFRVVLVTRLFGYFESEGRPGNTLPEKTEIERLRGYFARQGMDVPVAIGGHTTVVDGKPTFGRDENYEHYRVAAIPQFQLIDRQGKIRRIMVGYDDAYEERLATIIEALLKEKEDRH